VAAHEHSIAEFAGAGTAAGLTLLHLGAFVERSAPPDAVPRLLSVLFGKPGERYCQEFHIS
jgi:hypothetical protein